MSTDQSGYLPPAPQQPQGVSVPPQPVGMPGQMPGAPAQPYQQMYQQPQQPGAWPPQPMQYMPAPPPAPSPLTNPKALSDKLPMIALIVAGGYALYALYLLIMGIVNATGARGSATFVFSGIFGAISQLAIGLAFFALLMGLKHLIDLKQASTDANKPDGL